MARVLVISDQAGSRDAVVGALRSARFEVVHAPDEKTGCALARELGVDLVFCDFAVCEQDVYEVLQSLCNDASLPPIPVIVLAEKSERSAYRKAMNLGADDYLVKPCTAQELTEAATARLDKSARARTASAIEKAANTRSPTLTSGLSVETRIATALYADIRQFDAFGERLTAEELSQLLQKFLSAACEPIAAQRGRVIKFLGGGLLALFEEDDEGVSHARRALLAAHALSGAISMFRRWIDIRFSDRSLPQFSVGRGVHTGEVATSTIGLGARSEYSVFGEPVQVATLLEKATQELDCSILASHASVRAAGGGVMTGKTHQIALVVGSLPLEAFEVLDLESLGESSVSTSMELPDAVRYALEVNCEVTSRAMKSAALTSKRPDSAPSPRRAPEDAAAAKPDLASVKLPIRGYSVLAKLGQGGMSAVYLVQRDSDGLQLALKLLDTRGSDSAGLLERFIQEFEIISAICHPNVAAIYDQGVTDEGLFILMEYFERGDLKRRVRKGMTPQQAAAALLQVATGLREIHARGVVHRDMKPENLLLRADRSLAVADFGIAKAGVGRVASTAVGALMGTPHYVSPEQVKGKAADARSDLYSLGVIFFEMLTGQRPFRAEQLDQLLLQHVNEEAPALPSDLAMYQPVVSRLMAKDPAERYQTAMDLLEAMRVTAERAVFQTEPRRTQSA